MNDANYTSLTDRGILSVSGKDSLAFLQGIVTNDVTKVSASQVIYSALLTPQGKYLSDFFIAKSISPGFSYLKERGSLFKL